MRAFIGRLRKSTLARMIVTFILIIVPLYVLGFAIYSWAVHTVRNETSKTMLSQVEFFVDNMEEQIGRTKSLLYDCIADEDLRQLSSIPESLDEYGKVQAIARLQKRLVAIGNSSGYIEDVRAYIPAINRVVKTTIGGYATNLSQDEFDAVYQATKAREALLIHWNDDFYLCIAYPVTTPLGTGGTAGRKPLFILAAKLSKDALNSSLQQFSGTHKEGAMLAYLQDGSMLSGVSSAEVNGRIWSMLDKSGANSSGSQTMALDKKPYLVMYSRSDTLGVMLSAYIPESEVFSQLDRYKLWFWLFTALALALVVLYSFITYRQVHKPLVQLTGSFRKLEKGDMSIAIEHAHDDEFKYLYSGFNEMVGKLNVLIDQVYKQKILAQHAQLKQLQSQINPHFLYNSFFMLHRMVQAEDYDNLSTVSEQLGSYFKYITRSAADDVELSEEVDHARIYAEIQAMRFRNRIKVEFAELPRRYRKLPVPRLILQPIIENSIEHGMKDVEENGLVSIGFEESPGCLTIAVEDNGDGIGEDELARLNLQMNAEDDQAESTGIINIHRRIRLKFGPDSGLALFKAGRGGIRAEIQIRSGEVTDAQAADC